MARRKAAVIGGGVIGGGWAARFQLMGWDVAVFDPDPEAERKIGEVLDNARRALPGLFDVALPSPGRLVMAGSVAEAVEGADWVQESVPERLELKHKVLAEVQAHTPPGTPVGSSTSGFRPSALQEGAPRPGDIFVAHPFNPVYLLPLVELVGGAATQDALLEHAADILRALGMYPLRIRAEIDAHVADRLLEAVWREALWLVKDGVATTTEIDEAIRMGFGLRWAQMGLFETYRVAGGEAGMRHFIGQFGPALKWPWTRLMDVPELTEELVERIARQSDEQSGHRSIRALERARDENLVGILRALKARDWGAGAVLAEADRHLGPPPVDITRPIETQRRVVPLDWTDYNGHMNEARYLQAFSDATDRLMEIIGCDAAYIAAGGSYFTAETHIRHLDEIRAGEPFRVETRVLHGAGKKMHLFHEMRHGEDGRLLATGEHFLLHVSLETRRASPPAPHVEARLAEIAAAHAELPEPDGVSRAIRRPG
ncbi:MAG: carnitine 3-dehydrogenase [Alphaproteobacteria bacterium]|nr:MAG: carnitine 3-dehydrogenase [Alphaproteobacteria bacterium]